MQEIGGYFGLELKKGEHFHKDALRLNTGRNCFEYILRAKGYTKVYIPFFTCDVLLEPLKKLNIDFEFYSINENLEPVKDILLEEKQAYLYTNYFGLKQDSVRRLAKVYKNKLIVDNAQAFYAEPLAGIDTFYSARKFFGVTDGAYLYTDTEIEVTKQDVSFQRMTHLLKRIDLSGSDAYKDFQINDQALIGQSIKKMSKLSEAILASIDYGEAKKQRIKNYKTLDFLLSDSNKIKLELGDDDVPMVYSYFNIDKFLKNKLIDDQIYVATYWPNVLNWTIDTDIEHQLTTNGIFFPVDQRYNEDNMKYVLEMFLNEK